MLKYSDCLCFACSYLVVAHLCNYFPLFLFFLTGHMSAIYKFGPCPIHRWTFAPMKHRPDNPLLKKKEEAEETEKETKTTKSRKKTTNKKKEKA